MQCLRRAAKRTVDHWVQLVSHFREWFNVLATACYSRVHLCIYQMRYKITLLETPLMSIIRILLLGQPTEGKGPSRHSSLQIEACRAWSAASFPTGRILFFSGPYYVPAYVYRGPSPGWELAKDPLPRLVLFLICQ